MNDNDKELKPCPFCGGVARLREYRTFDEQIHGMVTKYYVQCEACGIEVPALGYGSDSKATEAWNRRAKDPKKIIEEAPGRQPERICKQECPVIFKDAGPGCVTGNCPEEKPCGHPRKGEMD